MNSYIFIFSLASSSLFLLGAFESFRQLGSSVKDSFLNAFVCSSFFLLSRVGFACVVGKTLGLVDSDYIISIVVFISFMIVPLFIVADSVRKYFKEKEDESKESSYEAFEFTYEDANGNISLRQVENITLLGDRFDGFCKLRMAKRTFVVDRIIGCVIDLQTGEYLDKMVWLRKMGAEPNLTHDLPNTNIENTKYVADFILKTRTDFFSDSEYNSYIKSLPKMELSEKRVHFTGFKLEDRRKLEALANTEGMIVSHSVNNELDYCVVGVADTPKKKKSFLEAKRLGIPIFDSEIFLFRQAPPPFQSENYSEEGNTPYLIGSDILFTGFKRDTRLKLEDSARACGMVVRTKVTKNLSYLVCGPRDAPAKRLEAIGVGASILYGEDEFRSLIAG